MARPRARRRAANQPENREVLPGLSRRAPTESRKSVVLRVRITPELLAQLEYYANRLGIRISAMARYAIVEGLAGLPERRRGG